MASSSRLSRGILGRTTTKASQACSLWEATGYATRRDILRAAATLSHALVRALAEEGYGVDFLADSYNTLAITRAFSIVTISTESGVQR